MKLATVTRISPITGLQIAVARASAPTSKHWPGQGCDTQTMKVLVLVLVLVLVIVKVVPCKEYARTLFVQLEGLSRSQSHISSHLGAREGRTLASHALPFMDATQRTFVARAGAEAKLVVVRPLRPRSHQGGTRSNQQPRLLLASPLAGGGRCRSYC